MKLFWGKLHFAFLLLKIGGVRAFWHQLRRQLYSKATHVGLENHLEATARVPCRLKYFLRPGTEEDIEELIRKARTESKESTHRLLYRKFVYQAGLRNYYVARTTDTDDLCYIQWMITAADKHVLNHELKGWFPRIKDSDCLLENAYTFEKYRGNRIMPSVMAELCEIAKKEGCKRVITYVLKDNASALRGCEQAGFKKFAESEELRFFFLIRGGFH